MTFWIAPYLPLAKIRSRGMALAFTFTFSRAGTSIPARRSENFLAINFSFASKLFKVLVIQSVGRLNRCFGQDFSDVPSFSPNLDYI